jgi:hypothetical protein
MNLKTNATMKKISKKLPCEISDAEHRKLSEDLVGWLTDIDDREQDIARVKDKHKGKIKHATEQAEGIRLTLRTGTIPKDVDCAQIFNWDTMMTHVIRIDTKTLVPGTIREMTPEERQMDHTQKPCPGKYLLTDQSIREATIQQPDNSTEQKQLSSPEAVEAEFEEVEDVDSDEQPDSEIEELNFDAEENTASIDDLDFDESDYHGE